MSQQEIQLDTIYTEEDVLVIFDGQGTQWPGMGKDVYKKYAAARELYRIASDAVGVDIKEASFGNNTYLLQDTRVAQPAIAAIALAKYRAWQETNPEPAGMTGLSKGLYTAVGVSAIKSTLEEWDKSEIDYKTLKLISGRAKIMYDVAEGKNGRMLPVIGPPRKDLERILKGSGASIGVYVDRTVHTLTGKEDAIENSKRRLVGLKAKILDYLPIHQAAHSELQLDTVEPLKSLLLEADIGEPHIRIAANDAFYLEEPKHIIEYLLEQMTTPADWHATESMLAAQGIRNVIQLGADEKRSLARQMAKNHKDLGINSIVFPPAE